VVYHLLSLKNHHHVCLKVGLPEQNPAVPTLTDLWATANWQERETYDLYGITFTGHPGLQRILMPEDWEGHPLRKDVPLGGEEVAFTFNQDEIYAHKPFVKE
jgi:NADH-quinone oxidoreductase subunit C